MKEKEFDIKLANADQCTGCSACASVCPTGSINMWEDEEGFLQPQMDMDTCIGCHKCEKTCPIIKQIEIPSEFETQVFAAINKDDSVRMRSSSGGMFYALAKWTIEHGGVVFGARFDEKWDVVHDYTETIEGIEPFMRSKYVQSRIGETYKQAKEFLKEGRQVLFVGTPCQIGGLHAYLGKDYENLLLVDFICHGVPSPGVWREYLKEKVQGDKVLDVNFRDKRDGWRDLQSITTTTNTNTIRERQCENMFFKGFISNVYLRKSCYDCQFKQVHRISDLTMADYWGIENVCPEIDDDKGISAVLVHSEKGRMVLEELQGTIQIWPQNTSDVVAYNQAIVSSVSKSSRRNRFYFYYRFLPIGKLAFAIKKDWIWMRVMCKLKKVTK